MQWQDIFLPGLYHMEYTMCRLPGQVCVYPEGKIKKGGKKKSLMFEEAKRGKKERYEDRDLKKKKGQRNRNRESVRKRYY